MSQPGSTPYSLELNHGTLLLPVFFPDATQGVVRAVDAQDLLGCGIQALQMNVFHLMQKPGSSTIKALGGLHGMSGWDRPIVTDSGGFQVYSLIRQNARFGSITDRGIVFRPEGSSRRYNLTPDKSVQLQVDYGADIVICLDDCTDASAPIEVQRESVERTIRWARRSREAFDRRLDQLGRSESERPQLFAVIQGGAVRDLRRRCAEELLRIGFDGYGLGGWPLDEQGKLLEDIIAYTRELVPAQYPMHALGVGQPGSVVTCARLGYHMCDSTMPTRDARHGRLLVFTGDPATSRLDGRWYDYIYAADARHTKASGPISPHCDALCCRHYSLGYIHHLFDIGDSLFYRLATIHNLRFMTQLMARLRADLVRGGDDG